jgi:AmmeMemoRadiSam system protein A
MSSVDAIRASLAPHAVTLHGIAHASIRQGFARSAPSSIRKHGYSSILQETMASFVTLRKGKDLRGCVGTAYATHPLAEDVSRNAFHAAFSDTRFSPVSTEEFEAISIEVSVLSPPQPISYANEEDLVRRLVPGRDGLILEYRGKRGLFLPQVWDTLSDADTFLDYLKDKAGLPSTPLDPAVQALRFEAIKFQESPAAESPMQPRRVGAS